MDHIPKSMLLFVHLCYCCALASGLPLLAQATSESLAEYSNRAVEMTSDL